MAAGVPTTGIGGIFYILLSIGMFVCKVVKKILSFIQDDLTRPKHCKMLKFPTVAFILCISLLLYMNVTGFRLVLPGTQQATVSMSNLWILGVFAFSFYSFFILLFHIRAKQVDGSDAS